jgi:hypothetical protein
MAELQNESKGEERAEKKIRLEEKLRGASESRPVGPHIFQNAKAKRSRA